MQSKMNLSFSILLMLMLTQAALCDVNSGKPRRDNINLDQILQKVRDLVRGAEENVKQYEEQLKELAKGVKVDLNKGKQKIDEFLKDLSKLTPEEIKTKIEELAKQFTEKDIPEAKQKILDFAKSVDDGELGRKLQDAAEKLSKMPIKDIPEKVAEIIQNAINQGSKPGGKN